MKGVRSVDRSAVYDRSMIAGRRLNLPRNIFSINQSDVELKCWVPEDGMARASAVYLGFSELQVLLDAF